MKLDKTTLQVLANYCAAAAESMGWTLMRTAHSTFVKETEDFSCQVLTRARTDGRVAQDLRRHLVHRPRLRRRDLALRLPRRRHLHHQRSLCRQRRDPHARHPHVEAGVPRRRDRLLRRQSHPQHRRRRRGAGNAVADADRDPAGGLADSADAPDARRRPQSGPAATSSPTMCACRSRTGATSTPRSPA